MNPDNEKQLHSKNKRVLFLNILINVVVGTVKWVGGIKSSSQALVADALETTADIISSIIVLVGYNKAIQPPDQNHPYGHGKLEPVISFIIGIVLIFSAGVIIQESIKLLLLPDKDPPRVFALYIALGVIIVKECLYHVFKKIGQKTGSTLFHNEAIHHRTDALTSVLVVVGVGLSLIPNNLVWFGDYAAAILASGIILFNAYKIIRKSLSEIMDEQTYPQVAELIENTAAGMSSIESFEKCYVRKSGNKFYCDIHIRVNKDLSVKQGHDISHDLKDNAIAQNRLIADIHIHIEPTL